MCGDYANFHASTNLVIHPPHKFDFTAYQGETLGDVKAGDEEVVSAADWVNRSRKKAVAMEEERLLAKQRERCCFVLLCLWERGMRD